MSCQVNIKPTSIRRRRRSNLCCRGKSLYAYVAARDIVRKNPVIETMIDWYLVLRDIPALQHLGEAKPNAFAFA